MSDTDTDIPYIDPASTNSGYTFYPGWVPASADWTDMFTEKVDAVAGYLTNPTVFGNMTLVESPTSPLHATNKAYVDTVLGESNSLPDAPADGTAYCRLNNAWSPAPATLPSQAVTGNLSVSGAFAVAGVSTLTQLLIGTTAVSSYALDIAGTARVSQDPVNPTDLVTKQYVDNGSRGQSAIAWTHPVAYTALAPIPAGLWVLVANYGGSPVSRPSDNNGVFVIASDGTFTANTSGTLYAVS